MLRLRSSSSSSSETSLNPFGTSSTTSETSLNPFGTSTAITNTTDQPTTTINDLSSQSSETLANTHGLFEDFPGLAAGSDDVENSPHLPDMGDDRNIIAFDDPESLLTAICDHFSFYLETTGTALPAEWSIQEFSRTVIGEEVVQDPSYLSDVLSDLSLHGLQSWYWEEAVKLLTRITSSVM